MGGLVPVKDERTSTGTYDGVGTGAAGKQEMELSAKAALQQEECKRG